MMNAQLAGRRVHTVIGSPIGPITLTAAGTVLTGLYMGDHRHAPDRASFGDEDAGPLGPAGRPRQGDLAGPRPRVELAAGPAGPPFQQRVWEQLRAVGYGCTISYGELARRIGQPAASRAVGLANGRNPISIVIPCHRVIGSSGRLIGYGGGLERKRFLLDFERTVSGQVLA